MRSQAFTIHTDTDQQGRFRFDIPQERNGYQVQEDRYRLCAEYSLPNTVPRTAYPMTCFAGASSSHRGEWIELHPGQSRDFTFRLKPVPGGAIAATVTSPQSDTRISVFHVDRPDFRSAGPYVRDALFNPKTSRFELMGIVPGKYRIRAQSGVPDALLAAAVDVEVLPGKVTNVQLSLTPSPILRGRLRTDDGSPLRKGEYRRLSLLDPEGGYSDLPVNIPDDGFFKIAVRNLASYRLAFDVRRPWHVASATWRGIDALAEDIHVGAVDRPELLDVVLSRSAGTIEGSVAPREGASHAVVLLLRRVGSRVENAAYLAQGTMQIGIPGSFKWNGIPPGTYWILVVSKVEAPFLEMEFLKQHQEFIQEVKVGNGSTSRVQVRLLDLH
jgi:hypothetical protein